MALLSQILLASEAIHQAEHIVSFLQKHGFDVLVVEDVNPVNDWDVFDAIISVPNTQTTQLYQQLHALKNRPLLVWVTDHLDEFLESNQHYADTVLPNHPIYIEQQLKKMLAMRAELNELRPKLDQQLQRGEEIELLKNAIVRNVSHEMKTPLLQVKAAVSLITEEMKGDNERLAEMATNAMSRLESIVQNITMLGSSLDIELAPMILHSALNAAVKNLARTKPKEETERVKLLIEDHLPAVLAQKNGLATVLRLLIDNALKFSKDDVDVIAHREDKYVYVGVKDYGIGIEEARLQDIFELFFQVDGSTTRQYGGMGTGLALVKLILEHHNTEIFVESEPGKGSIFYFFLEIADPNKLIS
ncbi:MAG: hypothetical protein CL607_15165 [Anaerolineaceae bacterium]|nr:hypothetical protein [Anaerolineaceae bacterium]